MESCYIKTFGNFEFHVCSECKQSHKVYGEEDLEKLALFLSDRKELGDEENRSEEELAICSFRVDCDQFEKEIKEGIKSGQRDRNKAIEAYLKAIDLYQGPYFERIQAIWILPKRNYYHNLYLKSLRNLIDLFEEQEDFNRMVSMCEKAIEGDRYEEYFHLQFMKALRGRGEQRLALRHYQEINHFYLQEMGIEPSKEMKSLYKELLSTSIHFEQKNIQDELGEEAESEHAFYCEAAIFRSIYELERKRSQRSKIDIRIAVVEILGAKGREEEEKIVQHVHQHLMENLRKGDVITRWNEKCFLILLHGVEKELMQKIVNRVLKEELQRGWIQIGEMEKIS